MNDVGFHLIEILIQSGMLLIILQVVWKASAALQELKEMKDRQEEHIKDDKIQFGNIDKSLSLVEKGLARVEGRINGKLYP